MWTSTTRLATAALASQVASSALVAAALVAAPPADAATTTLYVRGDSCSAGGAGTQAHPFCTISEAASVAAAGQTVEVASGTYRESVTVRHSGTATSPLVFTAAPGASVTLTGGSFGFYLAGTSYVVINRFHVTSTNYYGIYLQGSSHITVSENTVTFAGQPMKGKKAAGIMVSGTTSSTLTGNTSDHNSDHGFYVQGGSSGNVLSHNEASWNAEGYQRNANGIDVISPGNSVIGNVLHDNEDSGLQFYSGGDDNLAALNVSYNNGDHGIDNLNVTGGRLVGNTVFHNCTSGINVEGTSGHYVVENNIAVDNAVYPAYQGISCSRRGGNIGIWDSAPSTTTVDHNLVHLSTGKTMYVFGSSFNSLAAMRAATGQEQHGIQADPGFAHPASGDLSLTEGSPGIDAADSAAPGAQASDILGHARTDDPLVANRGRGPRAFDDIGAYEFISSGSGTTQPPSAALSVSPTSGTAPLPVTANAGGSTDPQGQALTYTFDFGDGTVLGPQPGPTASHTFPTPGTYPVAVTVRDESGLTDTTQHNVVVSGAAQPPSAALSVSPTSGTAPLPVTANAGGSTDPQGQALTYTFDFGDGTVLGPQPGPTASHTFPTPGTYPVAVTVRDESGLTDTTQHNVVVSGAAQPPSAALSVSPTSGTAPLPVTANAGGSTDPQGQALTYTFDFGDGTVLGPQPGPTASHTFPTPGTYPVAVTVRDESGLSDTTQHNVVVSSPAANNPAFVSQIATNYSTKGHSSGYITVWRNEGVSAGDVEVVTVRLTGTGTTGTFSGTDQAGNTLTLARDVSDGNGNRLAVLYGVVHNPLAAGQQIIVNFPGTASTYRIIGDEISGVTGVDRSAAATGTSASFSSGPTATTSTPDEFVFATVGISGGSPSWVNGWTPESSYAVGTDNTGRAYQVVHSAGSYAASGTTSGAWGAICVTFR